MKRRLDPDFDLGALDPSEDTQKVLSPLWAELDMPDRQTAGKRKCKDLEQAEPAQQPSKKSVQREANEQSKKPAGKAAKQVEPGQEAGKSPAKPKAKAKSKAKAKAKAGAMSTPAKLPEDPLPAIPNSNMAGEAEAKKPRASGPGSRVGIKREDGSKYCKDTCMYA